MNFMDQFQARADVDELKRLCEAAQRPKVADILTIEIRRLETKLSDLVKKSEAEASKATAAATPVAPTTTKAYDFQLKNYCEL